jgi:Dolichyl-phosphate-mannose-protein mannosyltransferase
MILDRELEVSPDGPQIYGSVINRLAETISRHSILLFGCFLIVVIVLQILSGAYRAEFSGYPDEPAHYVTSLMLRNYISEFNFSSPLHFAQDYYHHYPKVALGHWPPVFYIVQAFWMLLFSASRPSIRLEIAVTTALLAWSIFRECRRSMGINAGILAGALLVCLPLIQTYTNEEMAEGLLVLFCFWACIHFARYLESERWLNSFYFGVLSSLAVLTKGNGWLLALVPPLAVILTRKYAVLTRQSFWIAPLTVSLLCLPWQIMTMRLAAQGWEGGSEPTLQYTMAALGQFILILPQILGFPLLALLVLGVVQQVLRPLLARRAVASGPAVMFALLIAAWLFHSIVPAGIEDRKLIIAVPAMILFVFAGGMFLADHLPLGDRWYDWRYRIVAIAGAVLFFAGTFFIPKVKHYGYAEAASFITSDPVLRKSTILVSSESGGEGLLVSEIAMHQPRPEDVVVRATKALAQVNWNASKYHSSFSTAAGIRDYVKREKIGLVVVDSFASQNSFEHNRLLRQAIRRFPCFRLIAFFPNTERDRGRVELYRVEDTD